MSKPATSKPKSTYTTPSSLIALAVLAAAVLSSCGKAKSGAPAASSKPAPTPIPAGPMGEKNYTETGLGLDLEMVWIPPGSFTMGSPESEKGRVGNEGPQHRVTLDGFWMGKYEVTQDQWAKVMGSNPSHFKGSGRLPVEVVSWDDAIGFCKKLAQKTGNAYALPTEAQWEYACRAGTTTRFSSGDSDGALGDYAWYDGNSDGKTHEVGTRKPNPWGLHDMHGNAWEWCADWHDGNYYASSPAKNPAGPPSSAGRVLRGGSWVSNQQHCRSARRNGRTPTTGNTNNGFRVVRGSSPR